MMRIVFLAAFALAFASALPQDPDSIAPEVQLSVIDTTESYTDAELMLTQLKADGNDDTACRDLAKTAAKEVTDAVGAAQASINSLSDGGKCAEAGQDLVKAATNALNKAQQAADSAAEAATKAANANVDLGSVNLDEMSPGKCGTFLDTNAYKTAVSTKEAAETARDTAKGELEGAKKGLETAKKTADEMNSKCQCDAISAADKAFKAASESNGANAKAWTKAEHMKCVLDGVAPNDCKVGATPVVTAKKMAQGVSCTTTTTTTTTTATTTTTTAAGGSGCVKGWPVGTLSHGYGRVRIDNIPSRAACWARAKSDGYGNTPAISWHCNSNHNHGNGDCTTGSKGTCDYWKTATATTFPAQKILNTATLCHYWWTCVGGAIHGNKKAGTEL